MATALETTGKTLSNSRAAVAIRLWRGNPQNRAAERERDKARYLRKSKFVKRARYDRLKAEMPLWEWRARRFRGLNPAITAEWLEALWQRQDGRCALTNRSLDINTVELDHIVPRSRGGTNDLNNLRFLCPEANSAKGKMLDPELVALCRDILGDML